MMTGRFVEVCKRKFLKENADKIKVMVLVGEERSLWEDIGACLVVYEFVVCVR